MARSESRTNRTIAVAGGDTDPNLQSLLLALRRQKQRVLPLLTGASSAPTITWELASDALCFDGTPIRPAALFIRHDVFTNMSDGRPESASRAYAWFTAIASWAAAHPDVRLLNRHHNAQLLKPQQLVAATECGLEIPRTFITNDRRTLEALDVERSIAKPIGGGDYCRDLPSVLRETAWRGDAAAAPAIVQERLVPPELRIYRVGKRFLSFNIASDALDYRATNNVVVTPAANDPKLVKPLGRLMDLLQLDFGAADFKTSPKSGRYLFLEVNSSPMFAAFDAVSNLGVSKAISDHLRG
ncbi:MAG TPA: hypothetical protein VHW00_13400 [Thermoanaerobaculia bacterium]|nr:hypothetical protein [Thermoanaerobaculia bacterium]